MANNNATHEVITKIIADALNRGECPWRKPWQCNGQSLYMSRQGKSYSFLNSMLLMAQGKPSGEFLTFNQIKAEKGTINKGAKSAIITFYTWLYKDKDGKNVSADDENVVRRIPFLKYYRVFHVSDTDLQPKHAVDTEIKGTDVQPIDAAEQMLKAYLQSEGAPAFANDGGDRAYYSPSSDSIHVPALNQFKLAAEYYSTSFHECIHSTGHESRLDRLENESFGSVKYSREELVAEMGSAILLNLCGIDTAETYNNNIAYLQGWAKHLQDKPKEFATAAARADKAVSWFMGDRSKAKQTETNTEQLTDAA